MGALGLSSLSFYPKCTGRGLFLYKKIGGYVISVMVGGVVREAKFRVWLGGGLGIESCGLRFWHIVFKTKFWHTY
jgi:hypothetical protein